MHHDHTLTHTGTNKHNHYNHTVHTGTTGQKVPRGSVTKLLTIHAGQCSFSQN